MGADHSHLHGQAVPTIEDLLQRFWEIGEVPGSSVYTQKNGWLLNTSIANIFFYPQEYINSVSQEARCPGVGTIAT